MSAGQGTSLFRDELVPAGQIAPVGLGDLDEDPIDDYK